MKRSIIYALTAFLIVPVTVYAQQGDNRTTTTKIADLLALQPAETTERFHDAMQQLERFSAAEISALLQQLTPPGTDGNTGAVYAANSYSYHVLSPGKTLQRAAFIEGALDALEVVTDKDVKGFIIQLLQNAGDNSAINTLSAYLYDTYLSEKAARALARIGSDEAGSALLKALPEATGIAEINIINALGFIGYQPAEAAILQKANTTDQNLRRVVIYALSEIGGTASAAVLEQAASASGYAYDPTGATGAYVHYIGRLAENGHVAAARKGAARLFNAASTANQTQTRIAALDALTAINEERQVKALVKAAKDGNGVYRNAALMLLTPYIDGRVSSRLTRGLAKADSRVQVDILHYLGSCNQVSALPEVKKALNADDAAVRLAAVEAYNKLAGDAAAQVLLDRLAASDEDTQEAIKTLLLTSENKELPVLVTHTLAEAKDPKIQVLLLDVLAQREAAESMPVILSLIQGNASAETKTAAYHALPRVARPTDLDKLLELLLSGGNEHNKKVQEALVSSVTRSADKGAYTQRIIDRLNAADGSQKSRFFPVLSGIGGDTALAVVSGFTEHRSDSALYGAAVSALANWTDAAALPRLVELSREKTLGANRLDQVIKGLVQKIGMANVPAEQKVLHLRDAFEVSRTVDQKRAILKALEAYKTYNALMFAGRFLDDEQLKSTAANTVMNIALEDKRFYGADVTALLNKVIGLLSGSESSYLREAIQKHLNELPKGQGYVSLFNGQDLEGWKGLVANPIKRAAMDAKTLAAEQKKADEVMRQGWYVADGVLHFNGKGDNIATLKQYGDFELLVDWKLAKEGKDGDAGIYLRGTPQVQIWDTSRVNVGAQVGSGGLYNNKKHESKPLKVADNPLGEWNTFRIIMVGDRVTVYLNGELVTDSVVLENYWDRSLPIFPKEQIELQAHGTHVSYRDIYIRELPRKEVFKLSDKEKADGFEVLFDGTDLSAWTGNTTAYQISEEGTLAIYPTKGSGGNLYSKAEFADFIYRFEFRLTPGANNGIGIRTPMEGDAAYVGMEIQVLDDGADMYKSLAPYQYHGSVYGIIPAKRGYLKPVGEWNEEEIYIKGNHIRVTLNGTVIVDGDLAEATKNGTLDGKNHPGLARKSGHIAFLGHGSEVHFRNIRVKRL